VWTIDVYAKSALPPALAMFAIAGSVILLVAGVVVGFARARRRRILAATAEASVSDMPPALVEGLDVVLSGIVRHVQDRDVAVKVSVTQAGSETESSGSWSHSWTEIDREIILAPFLLELPGGQLVRVDPPNNVEVADALDQKVWINRKRRVLSAELVPGERIYARGRLERSDQAVAAGAYRDVEWSWALRAAGNQMLLSSEPMGGGLRQRAGFHRGYAGTAVGLLVVTQGTLIWFYQRVAGFTRPESVASTRYYQTTDDDGDRDDHYVISVRGEVISVHHDDFPNISAGTTVPIRFASEYNWNLGASPTISWWHGGLVLVTSIAFWCMYASRRRSSRPWFRRKVNESAAGRLPDIA
jgi:hypothetical protein